MSLNRDELLHHLMSVVGIRAPMTAAAVIQLIIELRRANLIDEDAVDRIKEAVAREAFQARPTHLSKSQFEAEIRQQLNRLFDAIEPPGAA